MFVGATLFASAPSGDPDSARKMMATYTKCLVKTDGYDLRAMLDREVTDSSMGGNWGRYATSSCLSKQIKQSGGASLSFAPILMRGGVFEAFYNEDFGKLGPVNSFEEVTVVHYPVATTPAAPGAVTYAAEMDIGDCTVRKMPSESERLISTPIASEEESAAIQALIPALSACTTKGQTMRFSKSIIRGMVAEVLYRLVAAKRGLAHAQG